MVRFLVDVEWDVSGFGIGRVFPIRQVECDILCGMKLISSKIAKSYLLLTTLTGIY